jgi:hypothetical protein
MEFSPMEIYLKGGPLDGGTVTIAVSSTTYSTRIENRHFVYEQSNERTDRGQQVFIHRPGPTVKGKAKP